MAPCDYDDAAAWHAHSGQLAHKACFVRHVLPALHAPDEVKGLVLKGLLQRICHLEANPVCQALLLRQNIGPGRLQTAMQRVGQGAQ